MALGQTFLARSRSGAVVLLIPMATIPAGVARRGGGFFLRPVTQVSFSFSGRNWDQAAAILECTDYNLLDTFLVLVGDIAGKVARTNLPLTWKLVVSMVEEWQTLLGRRAGLSPEQQLGLWGELWLVAQATDADALLAAWRGPECDSVDFFIDKVGLEVKTSRRPHVHHVSQRQVSHPVGNFSAYFLSMWVGIDPINGVSLAELIETLQGKVADPSAFLRKVATLGYSPLDREHYGNKFLLLEEPRWLNGLDVPRVREVDEGISEVRYIVTLDMAKCLEHAAANELWHHFCGAKPRMDRRLS